MIEDPFDPSNQQATLIQQHMSDNNAVDHMDPPGSDYAAEYDDPNKSHPIRLASKTILSHLVNHLFHFPMCAGRKSTLGSLLLACSTIHSPNLLTFFILKKTQKRLIKTIPTSHHNPMALPKLGKYPGLSLSLL